MQIYTPDAIDPIRDHIKLAIAAAQSDNRLAGGYTDHGLTRFKLLLELLEEGATVEDGPNGLIVNETVVVAVNTQKYRIIGRRDWKFYGCPQEVVEISRAHSAAA